MALVLSVLVQHVLAYSSLGYIENLYVTFSYPHTRNEECSIENGQVQQVKEQFFRPLECAAADGVTVGHSVTLIHISHVKVIILHNLRLYDFSSFITEITFHWGIVNIGQHAYVFSCPATVLPSSQPWFLRECLPFSVLLSSILWHASPVWPDSATTVNLFLHQVIK